LRRDQGNAFGEANLGSFYEQGWGGLPQDDREAARRYSLAARSGDTFAQQRLKDLSPPPEATTHPAAATLAPAVDMALPKIWTPTPGGFAARRRNGTFGVEAQVNGQAVPMMFDTGASFVTLRSEDAERLGINVGGLTYSAEISTPNGRNLMAPLMLNSITVGTITIHNVRAVVAKSGKLQESLLGQSFLYRLNSYKVESDRVVFQGN
jgi:clan AA aspartic protease (TIGR02281 family)